MEKYNSADIQAFKDVWVFCEQRDGELMPVDLELLSEGRRLADEMGSRLTGLLLGNHVEKLTDELASYGADRVVLCEHPLLEVYTTDAYTDVICQMIEKYKPEAFLLGATNIGRDLGPRCAARLHTGLCADCMHLDVYMGIYRQFLRDNSTMDEDRIERVGTVTVGGEKRSIDAEMKMTRPAFGGNLMATIICPRFRPSMATVRPGVLKKNFLKPKDRKEIEVIRESIELYETALRTHVLEVVKTAKKLLDLSGADYIVSVGRGIAKDVDLGLRLANELAETLGGVVGGSRAAIDNGWLDTDCQIGQTGKIVRPKVYVALGISGAIQHKVGMQDSECVIAINKDAHAPIFEVADYGMNGDLYALVPELIKAIKERKMSQ